MKVLWVKAGGLLPIDSGGRIRSYNILKHLARKHEVTFFTFYAAHENDVHHKLKGMFARTVCLPLQLPTSRGFHELRLYLRYLLSPLPYGLAKYCRPEVEKELHRLVQVEQFNIIICDFLTPAPIIPWNASCPKVLFTHNVESLIWRRHYQVTRNPVWKALCWREYRSMAHHETQYLRHADHVLTVSDKDRNYFAQFIELAKITVIPTGVDVEYFQPEEGSEESNLLVFTGSLDWLPNQDAVFYFARQTLPHIRRHIPETSFCVVGRRPSPQLQALATSNDGIWLTGTVDDIRPYLRRATLVVVPLRIGSGTRLKIFEAMAMGKAVVSTSVGAEGLPVTHGENILLADDPEDFARGVTALLEQPDLRRKLGRAARELVERNYSWSTIADQFEAVLARAVMNPSYDSGSA